MPFSHIKCQELSLKPSFQTDLGNLLSVFANNVCPSSKKSQMSFSSWQVTAGHPLTVGRRTVLMPREWCFRPLGHPCLRSLEWDVSVIQRKPKCVGVRERFREVLLAPNSSFLHPFWNQSYRVFFCFVSWSLAHVDTENLITFGNVLFKADCDSHAFPLK